MQIQRLWISKYKNIEGLDFKFESDLITLLVGQNGLGKSNLLEAIAIIFKQLDLASKEEEFTTDSAKDFFEFKIRYQCKANVIRIVAEKQTLKIELKKAVDTFSKFKAISFAEFKRIRASLLPDYIIGYYSGENNRIQTFFSTHSENRLKNLKSRSSEAQHALGKMFITDRNCGELLFFTMWVFKNSVHYGKKITELLSDYLKIEDDSNIQIAFNNPTFATSYPEKDADSLLANIQSKIPNPFWGLTGKIDKLLKSLYNNHTEFSIPRSFEDREFDKEIGKTGFVFFESLNYDQLIEDIRDEFEDPIHLFDTLHAANQLGILYEISAVLVKDGIQESHNLRELSEGERQLLTVLGLILIAGRDDCLFILDEPDTHLNPKWQREFVGLLHRFNLNKTNSHMLVATHSPLIVQASEEADIFLFKKNSQEIVEVIFNDFKIQNWRIDQVLVSEYFELPSARPPGLDEFMTLRERILSKGEVEQADQELLSSYEDELGIFPTGETREQIEAMLLIKKVAQKMNQSGD